MKAKTVLEDKFWIVEDQGERIGTLTKEDESYMLSSKGTISFYKSKRQLAKAFGGDFLTATITATETGAVRYVHGYPTKCNPFNSMFDIQRKLPLFTKSEKSKSVYCAGYYLIRFNKSWLKSFCPKLVTIERNEYKGPFKTDIEMKSVLSNVNRTS
jgi:hypothetical protein